MEEYSKKGLIGIVGMFVASLCFGLMAFFVRIISPDIRSSVMVFIRASGGVFVFFILYLFKAISFQPVNKKLLFLRGFFGVIALTLWFYSIGALSLSKAVFYFYSYPLYTAFFSWVFFREKIGFFHVLGMISCVIGLIFLSQFWEFQFSFIDIMAILSGAFAGAALSIIRELRKTDDTWTIIMIFLLMSMLISFPFAISHFTYYSYKIWIYLVLIVLISTLGQILMTYSFKYCSAVQGSVVSSTSIIFPSALGYFILNEKMSQFTLLGGVMILFGGMVVSLAKQKKID